MKTTRMIGSSAGVALALSLLAVAPARAGGDPGYPVGTVSAHHTAVLDGGHLSIAGSYTCEGAGDRIGVLGFEVMFRGGSATGSGSLTSLLCDGTPHAWAADVVVEGTVARLGPATFLGWVQVCESPDDPCPMKLSEQRIVVRRG